MANAQPTQAVGVQGFDDEMLCRPFVLYRRMRSALRVLDGLG